MSTTHQQHHPHTAHETDREPPAGFPIEAKISLGVILAGLIALLLKIFGAI